MRDTVKKIKRLVNQVRGLVPEAIPVGMAEFDAWAQSLIDTYPLPTANVDSIKFTLASIIMHLGPSDAYKSKFYFVLRIKAGASKQIASAAFNEIKTRQIEAAKQAEATANQQAVASDGTKK